MSDENSSGATPQRSDKPEPVASEAASHAAEDKLVRITREDDYEKRWIVVGKLGAVDFHCSLPHLEVTKRFGRTGGVEYHHRAPTSYMHGEGPHHKLCWILCGECWHDGTSLWASEYWIPMFEAIGEEWIWSQLEATYRKHEWPRIETATPVTTEIGSVPSAAS